MNSVARMPLTALLEPVNVTVRLLPETYNPRQETTFIHNLINWQQVSPAVGDVTSIRHFWSVHMLGAYEFRMTDDNDAPNGSNMEQWLMGWSESSATITPTNFVFYETIRDVWAEQEQAGMVSVEVGRDRVSAHEALHRFFGWHGTNDAADEGIMEPLKLMIGDDDAIALKPDQIKLIQSKDHP